jgi:putative transposase
MRPTRETAQPNRAAYFISAQTWTRTPFFRHARWAECLIETIRHYDQSCYRLHAFVVMPDHVHLLLMPLETLEKAVQVIKGGFSYRAHRAFDWKGEIWQPGFSDHGIRDEEDWNQHLSYIRGNPLKASLSQNSVAYPYMDFPEPKFPRGLKPLVENISVDVRAQARTLHSEDYKPSR